MHWKSTLLVLIFLILLPADTIAKPGAVWPGKKVIVHDYTGARWHDHVQTMVNEFNAILPKRAPRLVYQRHEFHGCVGLKAKRGVITICEPEGDEWWHTNFAVRGNEFIKARIVLSWALADDAFFLNTLCDEFMHALTDASHGSAEGKASCLNGDLTAPGAWDIAFVKKVYRKHGHGRKQR